MTNTLLTRHDPDQARTFHAEGTWGDETHYRLLASNAARYPEAPALRDGARRANRIGRSSHRVRIEVATAGDRYGLGLIAAQRKAVREWQRPIAFARFGEEARCDIY